METQSPLVDLNEVQKLISEMARKQYDEIHETIEYARGKLSNTGFRLYKELISTCYSPITAYILSQSKDYDYIDMMDRIFNTLARFSKEKQEYIFLKSLEAMSNHSPDSSKIYELLSKISSNKADIIICLAEILRMLEPYIVMAARETLHNVDDSKVKEYISVYGSVIQSCLNMSEEIMQKIDKNKDENNKHNNAEANSVNNITENDRT